MMGCVCKGPGFCERHGVVKSPHLYNLCRTDERFFERWERGTGPGQGPAPSVREGEVVHGKADILRVTPFRGFQDILRRSRAARVGTSLESLVEYELPSRSIDSCCGRAEEKLSDIVARMQPRVLVFHALDTQSNLVAEIARRQPDVTVAVVNHSSVNHLAVQPRAVEQWTQMLHLEHVVCLAVDSRWGMPCYYDPIMWPSPVAEAKDTVEPPTVVICSRVDAVKAIPAQLLAAKIVRQHGVRVLIRLKPDASTLRITNFHAMRSLVRAIELEAEWVDWGPTEQWLEFLQREASILWQPSLSESFNYATLDAASVGRPFVGSFAILHTPHDWRADPNDPRDIADRTMEILAGYDGNRRRARELAEQMANSQNTVYCRMLEWLLDGPWRPISMRRDT